MIFTLNRFKQHNTYFKEKIVDYVRCPLSLDVSDYVLQAPDTDLDCTYDLCGIVNHFGSLNFGHYTAYAKNSTNNQWKEFDDSTVRDASSDGVISDASYILFYRRRGAIDLD